MRRPFRYFLIFLLLGQLGCKPKDNTVVEPSPPVIVDIHLKDVSVNGCFNLEKFSQAFQKSDFLATAALMTTGFKALGDIPPAKLRYFSHAAFYYKTMPANEMGLFSQVRQKDCKTVQMLSASEEVITFDVVDFSETELTLRLKDKFRDSMMVAQKKALFERQQPYQYYFKYVSPTYMMITSRYSTVDPLCLSKKSLEFEIQKDLHWAGQAKALPQSYIIEPLYLSLVKESMVDQQSLVANSESENSVGLDVILSVMRSPVKEELKLCSQ